MAKHSATVEVNTDDHKALSLLNNLNKRAKGKAKDTALEEFLQPIRRQLESLQERMKDALLDLDTPLGKVKGR